MEQAWPAHIIGMLSEHMTFEIRAQHTPRATLQHARTVRSHGRAYFFGGISTVLIT
jgi:hypothetical protein